MAHLLATQPPLPPHAQSRPALLPKHHPTMATANHRRCQRLPTRPPRHCPRQNPTQQRRRTLGNFARSPQRPRQLAQPHTRARLDKQRQHQRTRRTRPPNQRACRPARATAHRHPRPANPRPRHHPPNRPARPSRPTQHHHPTLAQQPPKPHPRRARTPRPLAQSPARERLEWVELKPPLFTRFVRYKRQPKNASTRFQAALSFTNHQLPLFRLKSLQNLKRNKKWSILRHSRVGGNLGGIFAIYCF